MKTWGSLIEERRVQDSKYAGMTKISLVNPLQYLDSKDRYRIEKKKVSDPKISFDHTVHET